MSNKSLDYLRSELMNITKQHYPHNSLHPITGNGKTSKPRFMIVFINPTSRNLSSNPDWKGPRFPFIGCRRPWDIFNRLGIIDDELFGKIRESRKRWSYDFARKVLDELVKHSIYITNVVKNTSPDATLPKSRDIKLYLPYLVKEIEIIKPEHVISLGSIPTKALVKKPKKISEYYHYFKEHKKIKIEHLKIKDKTFKVIPCYYPIGRGEPKKALEMLKEIMCF